MSLQYGLFTIAATENIDINPKLSFLRTKTYINQDKHELYHNARDTSNTVSIEAELKVCQMFGVLNHNNKHIYHQKCQW